MKKLVFILSLVSLTLVFSGKILAQTQTLRLTMIGNVVITGNLLSSYTYTSENPRLQGVAEGNGAVTISIDGDEDEINANSQGAWSYTPTTLFDGGTYDIEIASGTETLSFAITISEAGIGGTEDDGASLPDTGIADYTYILVLVGVIGIAGAGMLAFNK